MEPKGWILFNVLVNRFHGHDPEAFFSSLPKDTVKELKKNYISSADTLPAARPSAERLASVHHSWWVETLERMPESVRPVVLASMESENATLLSKAVGIRLPTRALSPT